MALDDTLSTNTMSGRGRPPRGRTPRLGAPIDTPDIKTPDSIINPVSKEQGDNGYNGTPANPSGMTVNNAIKPKLVDTPINTYPEATALGALNAVGEGITSSINRNLNNAVPFSSVEATDKIRNMFSDTTPDSSISTVAPFTKTPVTPYKSTLSEDMDRVDKGIRLASVGQDETRTPEQIAQQEYIDKGITGSTSMQKFADSRLGAARPTFSFKNNATGGTGSIQFEDGRKLSPDRQTDLLKRMAYEASPEREAARLRDVESTRKTQEYNDRLNEQMKIDESLKREPLGSYKPLLQNKWNREKEEGDLAAANATARAAYASKAADRAELADFHRASTDIANRREEGLNKRALDANFSANEKSAATSGSSDVRYTTGQMLNMMSKNGTPTADDYLYLMKRDSPGFLGAVKAAKNKDEDTLSKFFESQGVAGDREQQSIMRKMLERQTR